MMEEPGDGGEGELKEVPKQKQLTFTKNGPLFGASTHFGGLYGSNFSAQYI